MLSGKKILLGVCGSIAAYKSALIVRLLVKHGAIVRVVMTPAASQFITPLTLSTLSKHPVLINEVDNNQWNNHVELGLWADMILIAPATANTISKLANGACDNLLTAIYLSARCPIYLAPAMDVDMWLHTATKSNLAKLASYGNTVIPVGTGELASGLHGDGRMAEPEEIVAHINAYFERYSNKSLVGKRVLITAGPTVEPIDPVRFISNHSTGKMGFALAKEMIKLGAKVVVIKGPTTSPFQLSSATILEVTTAKDMYEAVVENMDHIDIAIFAAAVADYTPESVSENKIKKSGDSLTLQLVKTKDIAKSVGANKRKGQLLVGFALETNDELANAQSKMASKNLDLIVLNSLNDNGAGFGYDTNKITVINRNGQQNHYGLKSKEQVAVDIVNEIIPLLHEN